MLIKILVMFFITLLPFLELRGSMPLGLLSGSVKLPLGITISGFGMGWEIVVPVCIISNIFLGAILYPVIDKLIAFLNCLPFFKKFWHRRIEKNQKKIAAAVEKWGLIGIAFFIGVPLPGTGTYSGAIGAYLLGISYRDFFIANVLGVLMAGGLVWAAIVSGSKIMSFVL